MHDLLILIIYISTIAGIVFIFSTIGIYAINLIIKIKNFVSEELDEGHIWVLGIVGIFFLLISFGLYCLVEW